MDNQFATIILHHGMNDREGLRTPEFSNILMMKFFKELRLSLLESMSKAKYYVEVAQLVAYMNDVMRPELSGKQRHVREFDDLFFDVFDPATKSYVFMSDAMKSSYDYSLKLFYKTFSGKELPGHVKKFSDICVESTCMSLNKSSSAHEDLFSNYARCVHDIEVAVRSYQDQLNAIFTSMFTVTDDDVTFNREFSRGKLRPIFRVIKDLMAELEKRLAVSYKERDQYFEAIIEKQFLATTLFRIRHLEETRSHLY